jgi:alpha-N-arabinofuranosidase
MLHKYLLLPLLASYGAAVTISVAKTGGNSTSGLQYGAMEEVFQSILYAESASNRHLRRSITAEMEASMLN